MSQRSAVETRTVSVGEDGMRLDRWFKTHYATLPHSRLEKLLRTGQVRVDGGRAKASTRLATGQSVRVPPLPDVAPPPARVGRCPQAIAPSSPRSRSTRTTTFWR